MVWAGLSDRQEAGSPNVVGAVALAEVPGTRQFRMWGNGSPRVPILPFAVDLVPYARLAAALSAEHGIAVRHGCFCAHPLMVSLFGVTETGDRALYDGVRTGTAVRLPGAVRASMGVGSTAQDAERLVEAVGLLASDGPRWSYRSSPDGAECWPDPDPRPMRPFALTDLEGTT